jgi:hypothetical protein
MWMAPQGSGGLVGYAIMMLPAFTEEFDLCKLPESL